MDNDSWGAGDTETVGACPLCASRARTLLHGELVDRVFFTAPGPWQLWRCDACGAGYLDRRPTPAAIGRAYRTYFTHDQALPPTPSGERLGLQARLKRAALNDAHLVPKPFRIFRVHLRELLNQVDEDTFAGLAFREGQED